MDISYILDNNLLIDKNFDNIMIYFRDQFIYIMKYIELSKQENFPLYENILKKTIFTPLYIQQIDEFLIEEAINIIIFIRNENYNYLQLIENEFISFKEKNQTVLENNINNVISLLSSSNLHNLDNKYNEIINIIFNKINNLIENNNIIFKEYLTKVIIAGSTHRTQAFTNKYNNFLQIFAQIKNIIQNNLKNILINKYKYVINEIITYIRIIIETNKNIEKYNKNLTFTDTHLKIINNIYQKFNNYFSDIIFNNKYLPKINYFIINSINKLNTYENELNNLYNTQVKLSYSSSTDYDYFKLESYSYRCCKFKFWRCWKHKTCYGTQYVGHNVDDVQKYSNIQTLKIDDINTNDFDILYRNIYNNLILNINSYKTILIELGFRLENLKNKIPTINNSNYINSIYQYIENIINNKLDSNLLISAYNYYKNEINTKLPNEFNNILEKWKYSYDYVDNYLNSNINNFKSSINDLYLMSRFYLNIYSQNISLDYSNSIVNKFKSELNYTINYYYNYIFARINMTYSYILNKIPTNENPFNNILDKRKNEIKNLYKNLLNKIKISKNKILSKQNQLNIIKISENDFFSINSFVKININNINAQLGEISKNLNIIAKNNYKKYTEDSVVARFYLENSQIGKQIIRNYEVINNDIFIDLKNDIYYNIINENMNIDEYNLLNIISNSLKIAKDNNLKDILKENFQKFFKEIINNFLSNFGKAFFDRILIYNEIGNINSLYNNLKYSISQSINYYISLSKIQLENNNQLQLPEDIKEKILSLNNLDSTIQVKNNQILSLLNRKFDKLLEDSKEYIIGIYFYHIINNMAIELSIDNNKKSIIEKVLYETIEFEYIDAFNKIIKNIFISEYSKLINKETSDIKYFIEQKKKEAKENLNKIFTLKTDILLSDIENKLTQTYKAIKEYDSHFTTFKISYEVEEFLYNYGNNIIYPHFKKMKDLLDENTKNIIFKFSQINYENYIKEYSIEKFKNKINIINDNLIKYFNGINECLTNYGIMNDVYESNFEKEFIDFEENSNNIIAKKNIQDLSIENFFQELEKTSLSNKEFIQNLNLFSNFDDKINKYINILREQYDKTENLFRNNKYNYDYYNNLKIKLEELYNISLNYYNQVNTTYYNMKESIINSTFKINELIQNSMNITYETIISKYIEIKNNFKPINAFINNKKESIILDQYDEQSGNINFVINYKIMDYIIENEFKLDIIFEKDDLKRPRIIGKIINKNRPNKFLIDFYSKTGNTCGRIGKLMEVEINNISLSIDFVFEGNLKILKININSYCKEYKITTQYYENKEKFQSINIGGIKLYYPISCIKIINEKSLEIVSPKKENSIITYNY